MQVIASKDNSSIKEVKKLKEKKYRIDNKKFIIEGFRFLEEGLKSDFQFDKIFVRESSVDKFKEKFAPYIEKHNNRIMVLGDSLFKTISLTENSQGVLATVFMKNYDRKNRDGIYILADKVQDPGNLGTIIRTAHSAGCNGIILAKDTVDVYNEKTLRSTMGSIFHIDIIEDDDFSFTNELIGKGFDLICSSLQTDKNFYEADLRENIIIAVGNEGNGVSDEVMDLASTKVKIPMPGNTESLNVAIAASIMIFEAVRQKLQSK